MTRASVNVPEWFHLCQIWEVDKDMFSLQGSSFELKIGRLSAEGSFNISID